MVKHHTKKCPLEDYGTRDKEDGRAGRGATNRRGREQRNRSANETFLDEVSRDGEEYRDELYAQLSPEEKVAHEEEISKEDGGYNMLVGMLQRQMASIGWFCGVGNGHCEDVGATTVARLTLLGVERVGLCEKPPSSYRPQPDCPLCFYPLPPKAETTVYMPCCGQIICRACYVQGTNMMNVGTASSGKELMTANFMPGVFELRLKKVKCPFCRAANILPVTKEAQAAVKERLERQAVRNDARALVELGKMHRDGEVVWLTPRDTTEADDWKPRPTNIDTTKAREYFQKAASLKDAEGHYQTAMMHVAAEDAGPEFWDHLQRAAQAGHLDACTRVANIAACLGRSDVAMKYWTVVASSGCSNVSQKALQRLTEGYKAGDLSKAALESALRASQSSREEFASDKRVQYALLFAASVEDVHMETKKLKEESTSKNRVVPCSHFL